MTRQKDYPEKGEVNHEADRRYREQTERFLAGADVDEAAREAKRAMEEDPGALEEAEAEGRSPVAEEDPEITGRPSSGSKRRP